ncbi:MAG: hypothetical protein AAF810_06195 [Cyanobacteria bacterium P01_D01_bin.36]
MSEPLNTDVDMRDRKKDRRLASLEALQPTLSEQQLKAFSVMCYRMIEPSLSEAAKAAVDWVANDITSELSGQPIETSLESVSQALQWDVIDPDAGRAGENRFSFEVQKLLEASPLEAARAAIVAVESAAELQAAHKQALLAHGETLTDFDQHLICSQVNGLLKRISTGFSSVLSSPRLQGR